MNIATWKCCGKNYTIAVKTCRTCGNAQNLQGGHKPSKAPKKPTASKETASNSKIKRKRRVGPDPLIGPNEAPAVSTLVMKDGRTAKDLH